MPLLFYGRLAEGKRQLYSKDLRPIESTVFDRFKVKHLSPYPSSKIDFANLWWFVDRDHTAVSWNECRTDVTQPRGFLANERGKIKEQTIFIPGFVKHREVLEIIRTEFPDYLVPGAITFRFNNQDKPWYYHDD